MKRLINKYLNPLGYEVKRIINKHNISYYQSSYPADSIKMKRFYSNHQILMEWFGNCYEGVYSGKVLKSNLIIH